MAGTFQPRFVDLVRNYSNTTGTGNLVLGSAVPGYTSFAAALQPGDQFYYSVMFDKANHAEVGRGTLQSDGTIARDPCNGVLTNFVSGTKTVSLTTAAEWYSQIQARPASSEPADGDKGDITIAGGVWTIDSSAANVADKVQHVADRSALANAAIAVPAAFLREKGREGTFVWQGGDHSAQVTADPWQGLYVASASDVTGASGAWVRKFSGAASARWWGAAGDGATNDQPAIAAALGTLAFLKLAGSGVWQYGSGASIPLHFPSGNYYCGGNTIVVSTFGAHIFGDGSGEPGGAGTQFTFDNDTAGFLFSGGTDATGSAGWMLERCSIVGGWTGGDEGEFHAVEWHWPGTVRDVQVYNFPGDGLRQNNELGTTATGSSSTLIDRVFCGGVRRGLHSWGADSNACEVRGLCVQGARQCAVWTGCGLGNSFYGCLGEANGTLSWNTGQAGRPCSYVSYNGNIFAVVLGQDAWCSTNPPPSSAANNQGWIYWRAGGPQAGLPAWFSGISVRAGGHYLQFGGSDQTSFFGCYAEGDGWNQIDQKALVIGPQGQLDSNISYVAGFQTDHTGAYTGNGILKATEGPAVIDNLAGVRIHSTLNTLGPLSAQCGYNIFGPSGGAPTDGTSYLETTNYHHFLQSRQWSSGSSSNIGMIDFAANAGINYDAQIASWATHTFKVQASPVAQINSGGLTLLSGALGYATGAGGAVTQATSKSTGVTLNRASGQITMNNAALAAKTSAGFTLTNSVIAQSDVVLVNIASGASADSYQATVDAVAAGSCRISLRNISSATLSEPVVLNFAIIKAAMA